MIPTVGHVAGHLDTILKYTPCLKILNYTCTTSHNPQICTMSHKTLKYTYTMSHNPQIYMHHVSYYRQTSKRIVLEQSTSTCRTASRAEGERLRLRANNRANSSPKSLSVLADIRYYFGPPHRSTIHGKLLPVASVRKREANRDTHATRHMHTARHSDTSKFVESGEL